MIQIKLLVNAKISFKQRPYNLYNIYIYIYIKYLYIYGIHHWQILWSSYRKVAWVGFEPTTTEFRLDTLTNWTIRPCIQFTLRANFVQLFQFHRLFSFTFHFEIYFQICSLFFHYEYFIYIYIYIYIYI